MQHEPTSPLLVIDPALGRADIPEVCARLVDLLARHPGQGGVVVCDVSRVAEPSAVTVDALARLRLTARRLGVDLRLRAAPVRLRQLLALTGLAAVIPLEGAPTDGSGELGVPESGAACDSGDPDDLGSGAACDSGDPDDLGSGAACDSGDPDDLGSGAACDSGDPEGRSAVEPHREAEEWEQPLHVEEVGDPPDPAG
ncbi:STAS domain-containing protein [Plantactinospora sp. WMMB782]|uniref:STAS domain-containing protein n=1 Tax=Plantactinospora sp. WMMB782 TaxID=3404121 RepID=UPI003B923FF4